MALNLYPVSLLQINDRNVDNFPVHETYFILIVLKKNRASSTIERSNERVELRAMFTRSSRPLQADRSIWL